MMTMETRKNLSLAALMASAVCALFLIVSAFAAAAHNAQKSQQLPSVWSDAEIHAPR